MELETINQTITDPADWDGSLFGTQLELVQLEGGEFRSEQTVTDIGSGVKLLRLTVNQSITVRSRPLTMRFVATLFDQAHGGHYAGASIKAGRMLVMPPAFDFDACVKDGAFSSSTLFVPAEPLEACFKTLVGEEIPALESLKIATPSAGSIQWITAWPDLVTAEHLASLSQPQKANLQESLLDSALTLLTHNLQNSTPGDPSELEKSADASRLAKARKLVRLAEDYSHNSPDVSLRMVDLCKATQVSERTLQYAFKACLGISPMNYLKRQRLHQVRHELKFADPAVTTVSSIACQFGFFHFGEFSQAYKAQFDESPSKTLKQA